MFFYILLKVNFMPPFGAEAPLTPKGGKHLYIKHFSSFSFRGKDVRRTGWGLFIYCLITFYRTVIFNNT